MLVLTRKVGERILLGPDIALTVVKIDGNKVRVGIEAPDHIKIVRSEITLNLDAKTRPARVLIVDRDDAHRREVREMLSADETDSFQFSESPLGVDALKLCSDEHPDCVVVDSSLPDLNSVEFLDRLSAQQQRRNLPVIMLTGLGNEQIAKLALEHGAFGCLVRGSYHASDLRQAVHRTIDRFSE